MQSQTPCFHSLRYLFRVLAAIAWIIGRPLVYRGPDGKEYVAILSGVGGWLGAIVAAGLDARDPIPRPRWAWPTLYSIYPHVPPNEERCMFSLCRKLLPDCLARTPSLRALAFVSCGGLLLGLPAQASSVSRLGDVEFRLASAEAVTPSAEAAAAPAADQPTADQALTSRVIRVAADPNNLPFSNARLEGFENRIVALLAQELGAKIEYTWLPERRGFFRQTLKEGSCDLVVGVPKGFERALTTAPYYKSTYVFLSRSDRGLDITSFDDARLRDLQIGVQMIGDDYMNTPPTHALAQRGIVQNVHGYTVYGDYSAEAPLGRIVDGVARGEIDVAVVWGPLAGYYSKRCEGVFSLSPVSPGENTAVLPFSFDICLGVRRSEPELRDELNAVLLKKHAEIEAILNEFGVPLADSSQ